METRQTETQDQDRRRGYGVEAVLLGLALLIAAQLNFGPSRPGVPPARAARPPRWAGWARPSTVDGRRSRMANLQVVEGGAAVALTYTSQSIPYDNQGQILLYQNGSFVANLGTGASNADGYVHYALNGLSVTYRSTGASGDGTVSATAACAYVGTGYQIRTAAGPSTMRASQPFDVTAAPAAAPPQNLTVAVIY